MISSQMLKGFLEGAILEVIRKNETYAYEISQILENKGFGKISEGTIYPIILRLQKNNYIVGELKPSPNGPKRKYYSVTLEGEKYLKEFKKDYQNLMLAMDKIFKGDNHEN